MNIAQIAPLAEAVPPRMYGGTERVVAYLADALVELGHDVTLFASGDSCTKARLVSGREQGIRLDPHPLKSDVAAHLAMLHQIRNQCESFDVLHFHIDLLHFPFFEHIAHRTVTTVHGRLDLTDLPQAYECWPQYPLVSVSDHQRIPLPTANWWASIPHGVPRDLFTFSPGHRGYVAFVGRISPEKRPDLAIEIAVRARTPLKIAAKVDPVDVAYFHQRIQPLLQDPLVEWMGEVDERQKNVLLGGSAALLFPIEWPEPFGLVMIEAMACGTPVIAWSEGSVPEVLEDGVTGFLVRSVDEAVDALARVDTLDRRRVRDVFERRFASSAMARNYVDVFERLAHGRPASRCAS
jgi:glycosyltransferase involved in cell wall biosynthesis